MEKKRKKQKLIVLIVEYEFMRARSVTGGGHIIDVGIFVVGCIVQMLY